MCSGHNIFKIHPCCIAEKDIYSISILWLNDILLDVYTTYCLSICQLIGTFWLL